MPRQTNQGSSLKVSPRMEIPRLILSDLNVKKMGLPSCHRLCETLNQWCTMEGWGHDEELCRGQLLLQPWQYRTDGSWSNSIRIGAQAASMWLYYIKNGAETQNGLHLPNGQNTTVSRVESVEGKLVSNQDICGLRRHVPKDIDPSLTPTKIGNTCPKFENTHIYPHHVALLFKVRKEMHGFQLFHIKKHLPPKRVCWGKIRTRLHRVCHQRLHVWYWGGINLGCQSDFLSSSVAWHHEAFNKSKASTWALEALSRRTFSFFPTNPTWRRSRVAPGRLEKS